MKIRGDLVKAGLAAAIAGMFVSTANAANVQGTATAELVAPIAIVQNAQMDFGTLSGGAGVGTVVLDTAGGRTTTGDAVVVPSGAGAAGNFTISGESGRSYILTISATATISDGTNTMTVNNFTNTSSGTLPAATEIFTVGATLNLGANQPAGTYTTGNAGGSTYTVTVNYN